MINGNPTIDYSKKYSTNQLGNLTNYIIVPHKDKEESKLTDDVLKLSKLPTYIPSQAKLN